MKTLFKLIVALGILLTLAYYLGGVRGFDASQQGRDARAAIGPGMSWQQVFAATREPKKYRAILKETKKVGGQTQEFLVPGPENKFRREALAARLAENSLPHGFLCTFRYSESVAFTVTFDGGGNVVAVEDAATMADLLQTSE
ncbi:MAG: hypothetical protein HY763_10245 [Planctomycetes bacterium]|nr:hypothetical protein [Planctomycetota bacterium]